MTRNTTLIIFAAAALAPAILRADEAPTTSAVSAPAPAAPAVTTTFTPSIVSQYMYRGVRLGGPAFEPQLEADIGNVGVGIWCNFPLLDKVPGVSDPETDPYVYYTYTINDSLNVVPELYLYAYPNADVGDGSYKATLEPNVALNYTVDGLKFTPIIYYDVIMQGPTYELSAAYSIPVSAMGTSLDFLGTVGTYTWDKSIKGASPDIQNSGDYWHAGVSSTFTLSKDAKLTVGLTYWDGYDNYTQQGGGPRVGNPAAVSRLVASVALAYSF